MRPSPTHSATTQPIGYLATGNDGNLWEIIQTPGSVKRWVRCLDTKVKPLFKTGDTVTVVEHGYGCHPCLVGTQVVIDKCIQKDNLFEYTIVNQSSYRHIIGEFDHSATSNTIDERSFASLDYSNLNIEKLIKQQKNKKMATSLGKGKSLTKNSAKEVRVIDTSLINKEEVFKMLALAESTGLPCLLVGAPGTGKTKTIIEYAKAWLNKDGNMTAEDFANKIYILETDEGTKASEIKGIN